MLNMGIFQDTRLVIEDEWADKTVDICRQGDNKEGQRYCRF